MKFEHTPVLLNSVMEQLKLSEDAVVIDGTLGLGGYSERFLIDHPGWKVIGIDQDAQARSIAEKRLAVFGNRFRVVAGNFRNINHLCQSIGIVKVDAVVLDLGVSNMQLVDGARGFSFKENGPLDMRMDPQTETLSANDLVNEASVEKLSQIFRDYGEERFSTRIAQSILEYRSRNRIDTTEQLVEIIRSSLPEPVMRKMNGHPARKVFQALRIAVNDELQALEEGLQEAMKVVALQGRVIVITYHSLEDRIVKKTFRDWKEQRLGLLEPRKSIKPSEEEIGLNPKSRSARLRGFIRQEVSIVKERQGPWRR